MLILQLVEQVSRLAEGQTVTLALPEPDLAETVAAWCNRTGNTLVAADARAVTVRRGRLPDLLADLAPQRRPGTRLWLYTNFDCNLACSYCCVRSSPHARPRTLPATLVEEIARQAPPAGVTEILITGGEPFLRLDLGRLVAACTAAAPTTLLTNGMLFSGRRLQVLRDLPRIGLTLQISLDSATPDRHDTYRGAGTWARAVAGIRTALAEGFTVKAAVTLTGTTRAELEEVRTFLDSLGIPRDRQVIRPLARRGLAETGIEVTVPTLVPEITVTADGIYWHPVGADDADQFVTSQVLPLAGAIEQVLTRFRQYRLAGDDAARTFPCA